ncbi:MAG TPA: toll/interleukin-1 receptor domain-containing protein [Chthonomonadaceae bacterium]|nr:toll/interleukin-1 receptor domain-containing protein [Chthonomonadaceae bacterium]
MPLKYGCFISYRTPVGLLEKRFIEDLELGLVSELEPYFGADLAVWRDKQRLAGGDQLDPNLAAALCQSVCMILVYTPKYFDCAHPYCAREYRAMRMLEKMRLQLVQNQAERLHSLIIPVVVRGKKVLPAEMGTLYYDFESFTLSQPELYKHPNYDVIFKQIAEYIYDRYLALQGVDLMPSPCESFDLPALDDTIHEWLCTLATPPGLPLR